MKNKRMPAVLLSTVCTALGSACACFIITGGMAWWAAVLMALAWYPSLRFWQQEERRLQVCFGTFGAAFMLAAALGVRLDAAGFTGWFGLLLCTGVGLGLGSCVAQLAIWLFQGLGSLRAPLRLSERKAFWIVFIACLVCWLPVLLAYFPGVTGYDMDGQLSQITTGKYHAHHPLLHTLFLQACIIIGGWFGANMSVGYGIHTVLQSILLAASIAYAMRWLCKIGVPRVMWWLLAAFFALSPQNALLSVAGTKDILFAAAFLMVCVEMIRFLTEKERAFSVRVWVQDIVLLLLAGLLRNNAIYALLVVFMAGVVIWRKKLGWRVLAVLLAGVVLTFSGENLLSKVTNAKDGSVREMLCIPCQQLARVHYLYGLNEPVGYECREVMPYVDDYSPERADHTKRAAEVDTTPRLIRFLKLWLRESVNFPIEYLDAFLFTCKGYWDVHDLSYSTIYDRLDPNAPRGVIVMLHTEGLGVDEMGCWPQVKEYCRRLVTLNEYQNNPLLWVLLHPAFYSWMLVFVLTCAWYRRSRSFLLSGALALAYLLTLMLGPCVLVRYQYYMMLIAPVLLGGTCVFAKEDRLHERS